MEKSFWKKLKKLLKIMEKCTELPLKIPYPKQNNG
jgi:hypothetical protein